MAERSVADFYFDFEQRYRGPRHEIRARLTVYRELLDLVRAATPVIRAYDYGCGRGEWLEVLSDAGFDAVGVDSNRQMLESCRAAGLKVVEADAIAHIAAVPAASAGVVSAFHFVEHLPIEVTLRFLGQAYEALHDGGLLVLETPNPENISVGTCSFWSDPTHVRPIPPDLLRFCAEAVGFQWPTVIRLNSSAAVLDAQSNVLSIVRRLTAASPDYAVIALKAPSQELADPFQQFVARTTQPSPLDPSIAAQVDASLTDVRERTDQLDLSAALADAALARLGQQFDGLHGAVAVAAGRQVDVDARLQQLADRLDETDRNHREIIGWLCANQADAVAGQANADVALAALRDSLAILSGEAESHASSSATVAAALDNRIKILESDLLAAVNHQHAMLASRSWRFTAPFRHLFARRKDTP